MHASRVVVTLLVATALAALAAPSVRADPDDVIGRPLVLAHGEIDLRLTAAINVQPRELAHPMSLAPDAWWGISPRWTLGLIHSDASLDQIATSASLCVRQSDLSACDRLYRGSGLDVRYSAVDGDFAVAPRLRALIRDIEPVKPAIALGALLRWKRGRFAIFGDPYLRLPLAHHKEGNRAAIYLPVWFAVQPATGWALAVQTGFDADLVVLRDGGRVPVALEATVRITPAVDLGIEAGWGGLFGPQHDGKHGTLMITAGWHG